MRWGMVIDLKRCIGCYGCQLACKAEHGTPPGVFYARVLKQEEGQYPTVSQLFAAGAVQPLRGPALRRCLPDRSQLHLGRDGIVDIDPDKCVGCRSCMMACPYTNRYFIDERQLLSPTQGATPYETARTERINRRRGDEVQLLPRSRARGQAAGLRRQLSDRRPHFRRSRRSQQRSVAADQGTRRIHAASGSRHQAQRLLPSGTEEAR